MRWKGITRDALDKPIAQTKRTVAVGTKDEARRAGSALESDQPDTVHDVDAAPGNNRAR